MISAMVTSSSGPSALAMSCRVSRVMALHPPAECDRADALPYRPVVSRGGFWDIIQRSIAARIATAAPMMTWTVIAVPWNPSNQGETNVHIPTIRLSHSSQIANAASAMIASTAITTPAIWAFPEVLPASNPKIQGEKKKNGAQDQVGDIA